MEELAEDDELSIHKIVVQDHRSVSDAIEDDLGVRHETPQAIIVHNGASVFDTSHFEVTADALRDQLRQATLSSN
jgi:bacillithiol system protein YtxJ